MIHVPRLIGWAAKSPSPALDFFTLYFTSPIFGIGMIAWIVPNAESEVNYTHMKNNALKKELTCDIAIIGGGPAGMMAAIGAAKEGRHVVLMEKNPSLGKKLLITGGGRCNVTNATFDNRTLAKRYGKKGKFLLSPLSKWNAKDTIDFFEARGMPTKTEAEERVFPQSNSAKSVLDVLMRELKNSKVEIIANSPVLKINSSKERLISVETEHMIISAKAFVLTTGGTAHPETGSSGDGFKWLKKLGHTVNAPSTALVPVKTAEEWSHRLQGLSFPKAKVTLFSNDKKVDSRTGKVLFTHFGLSGPLILNMSNEIGERLLNEKVSLEIDFFPAFDQKALDEALLKHLSSAQNKKWGNALSGFVPPLLASVLVELSRIDAETVVNKIPRAQRIDLVKKLQKMRITPTGLLGLQKAIVSSGGVALEEIDFKTMCSKRIPNLYFAGDILDFDRPSGGFSLQICWTTGIIAGQHAARSIK